MNDFASHSACHAELVARVGHLKALVDELSAAITGKENQAKECPAKEGCCQAIELQAKALEFAGKAKDSALEAGQKAVDTVRKYPVESAAVATVAVGTGLLVWWWMSRK